MASLAFVRRRSWTDYLRTQARGLQIGAWLRIRNMTTRPDRDIPSKLRCDLQENSSVMVLPPYHYDVRQLLSEMG